MADLTDQFPELTPEGRRILLAQMGRQIPAIQAQNVTPGGEISGPPPAGWRDVPQAPPIGTPLSRSSYTANPGGGMLSGQARDSLMGTGQGGGGASPLDALREQMGVINQLTGTGPQAPQINHYIEAGSPTAGLAQVGGRMVGNQTPDRVVADPAAALQTQIFGIQDRGHDEAQNRLFGRLGEMGRQAISGAQIPLEAIRLLGTNGRPGQLDLNQSQIEANRISTQQDLQLANDYRTFMNDPANGRDRAERQRAWDRTGMPLPGYAAGANAGQGGRRGPSSESTPESMISAAHDAVVNRYGTPGAQGARPTAVAPGTETRAITDMLTDLGRDPQFMQSNRRSVMDFLVSKFGARAVQDWAVNATQSGSAFGSPDADRSAANAVLRPGPTSIGRLLFGPQ